MNGYWQQLEQMEKMAEPIIWVVKTVGSRPDHECVIGDGMAKTLYAAGCIGLVTDGSVRDVDGLLSVPFAAYCRGMNIHHCACRFRVMNQPVEVGGITIRPGDILHANKEGVIKVPKSCLEKLVAKAIQMRGLEHEVHVMWRRTDLRSAEKRHIAPKLLAKYGF